MSKPESYQPGILASLPTSLSLKVHCNAPVLSTELMAAEI